MSTAPQRQQEQPQEWDSEQEHDGGEQWGDVELSSVSEDEDNESDTSPAPAPSAGVHSESNGAEEGATLEDLKDISSIQEDESYTQEDLSSVQEDATSMQGDNGVSTQGVDDASTSNPSHQSQPQQLQEPLLKLAQLAGLESQLSQNSQEPEKLPESQERRESIGLESQMSKDSQEPKNSHESQERRESTEQDSGFQESKEMQKTQASPAQRNGDGPQTDRTVEPSQASNGDATSGVEDLHPTKEESNGETSQHNHLAGATARLDEPTVSGTDVATVAEDVSPEAGNAVEVSQEQGVEKKTANGSGHEKEQGEAQERADDGVGSPRQTSNDSRTAGESVPVEEVGLQSMPGSSSSESRRSKHSNQNISQKNVTFCNDDAKKESNVVDSPTPKLSNNGEAHNGLKSPKTLTRPAPVGLRARLLEFAPSIAIALSIILSFVPCYKFGLWWWEKSNALW